MKSQALALTRVEQRAIGRHDLASSVQHHHDRLPSGQGQRTHSALAVTNPADPADALAILDLPVPGEARLKALFDLTAAEARLAQHLARGLSVEEAAQLLNIKMTTARTQLTAVFDKTDTRRQAKLVAILSRVAHLG
jgi:DNA-binding CsgD family transcriptional regulator